MIPIRDHNPSRRRPVVTWTLVAANVLIFLGYSSVLATPSDYAHFFATWGLVPAEARPATILTSMFLHGGLLHLAGNMLFLWIFGDNLEDVLGHVTFTAFYVACGVAAAAVQYVSDPTSQAPIVGASGAIAGVMGGYLLLFPRARVDILIIIVFFIRIIPVPAWLVLGAWFGVQVANGTLAAQGTGGVAYWAHAGGFVAGVLLTLPVWLRRGGSGYWRRTHGHPPHPDARYRWTRTNVPRVGR